MATGTIDLIDHWREQLADWSAQNPLLSIPEQNPYCLTVSQPSVAELFARLLAGDRWSFGSGSTHPAITSSDATGDSLAQRLVRLHHRTQQALLDRASTGLYLVGGALVWTDDNDEVHRSPLVLLPVALVCESIGGPFELHADHQEPFLNPALTARLRRDFDLRLPMLPQPDAKEFVATYFQELESSIAQIDGRLEQTAHLLPAALHRYFAYGVYQQHGEALRRHPFVQVLTGEKSAKSLSVAPAPEEAELDSMEHTESLPVLDVDGRQHLCLEAVARGHQFLVQSPPGTGCRQTIANVIAGCLAKGKTVLYVSPKRSALETVRDRLQQLKLDAFCLPLHRLTAGSQLKEELQTCLTEADLSIDQELPPLDWTKWIAYRLRLNGHVQALHEIREPLMRSVWSAIDELAGWDDLPIFPLGMPLLRKDSQVAEDMPVVAEIGPGWIEEATQSMKRLQELWHLRPPKSNGGDQTDSPWYGLKADRYTKQLRDDVLGLIDRVLSRLKRLGKVASQFAAPLSLPAKVDWLLGMTELLDSRPENMPASWLKEADPVVLEKELAQCESNYQARAQGRAPLTERYGNAIWSLDEGTADRVEETWRSAALLLSPDDKKGDLLLAHQQQLRGWAADTQERIPHWVSDLRILEKWLGVPVPLGSQPDAKNKVDPSPDVVRRYMRLVHLCQSKHAPERPWVHKKEELEKAKTLIEEQRPVFDGVEKRRLKLLETYEDAIFELELDRIVEGFAGPYQSKLRLFNSQFRKDRRSIKRRAIGDAMPPDYAEDMKKAAAVKKERERLESEAEKRKAVLGRYEKGFETNFDDAARATRIAAEAVELVKELGCESLPARMLDALCSPSKPTGKIQAASKRMHDSFGEWHHATEELQDVLPMKQFPETNEPLDAGAISNLVRYSKELQARLNQMASLTDPVTADAPKPADNAAGLVADLRASEQFLKSEETQPADEEKWRQRFGKAFQGVNTDWKSLRKKLKWAKQIHAAIRNAEGGVHKPPDAFIRWISGTQSHDVSTQDLRHAHEQYLHALHSLEHRFEERGPLHDGKPLAEHGPDMVKKHLQSLRDRIDELPAWIDWRRLPDRFGRLGLGAFWEELLEKTPPRAQLVDLFHKSFWHHWVEAISQSDDALAKFQSAEHGRVWEEYCELDRRVLEQNSKRVAMDATANRKKAVNALTDEEKSTVASTTGQTTVARIMESAPQLVQSLKPCILATPEWVNRALPAEKYGVDVVVVDEASLLNTAEASTLFFRGRQVLCFGDEHQLHPAFNDPTEEAAEMTAVQESVIDAAAAKGIWTLELSHHYRSEHERLFAFSNIHFYGQRLRTYPHSDLARSDLGIVVSHAADGVVDTQERTNAVEAKTAVALVMDHAKQNPKSSLGVIAATTGQAHTIWESLLDEAKNDKPLADWMKKQSMDSAEPLFVTEVDLAQGEVRDVIVVSLVLAKQSDGEWPADSLGWSRDEGGRRLNLVATGARKRLHLITSLRNSDIEADDLTILRTYLSYAEQDASERPQGLRRDEQTDNLQRVVSAELEKLKRKAVVGVGWGAHPLDIGVLDADAGQFLLGVELDGPGYQETPTARDRDRIRPEMLRQRGWRLHRVSSLGWWKDRDSEMKLLGKSVDATAAKPK